MNQNTDKFDVIIIGTGIGGLTAAALLSKLEKKRVLLLEKTSHIGGYTNLVRKQSEYVWETGVQAVGNVGPGSMNRSIFDFISEGKLEWLKLPDVYSKYIYPTFGFEVEAGENNYRNAVIRLFPSEAEKITEYFHDIKIVSKWFNRNRAITSAPLNKIKAEISFDTPLDYLALSTVADYMDSNFKSPQLRALLTSPWISYGLPPSQAAFAIHSAIVNHYLEGAYFPAGGSKSISEYLILPVTAAGGLVLTNHKVTEVINDGNKAVGVKTIETRFDQKIEREYYADFIISNIGTRNTYDKLIPGFVNETMKKELNAFPNGPVTINLFMALHKDPRELGFGPENIWIYNSLDNEENYKMNSKITEGKIGALMLSFPSLKLKNTNKHTAMIATIADMDDFKKWIEKPHRDPMMSKRILEGEITSLLTRTVEKRFPGFESMIGFKDLSLPVNLDTGEYIGGNVFGIPSVPQKFKTLWFHPDTPLQNFYLTGSDISGHGVVGGMLSGTVTLNSIMHLPISVFRIFRDAKLSSGKI